VRIFRRPKPAANRCSSAGSPHVLRHSPPAVEQTLTTKLSLLGPLPCFVCLSPSGTAGKFQESMPGSISRKLGPYSASFPGTASQTSMHRLSDLTTTLSPAVSRPLPCFPLGAVSARGSSHRARFGIGLTWLGRHCANPEHDSPSNHPASVVWAQEQTEPHPTPQIPTVFGPLRHIPLRCHISEVMPTIVHPRALLPPPVIRFQFLPRHVAYQRPSQLGHKLLGCPAVRVLSRLLTALCWPVPGFGGSSV